MNVSTLIGRTTTDIELKKSQNNKNYIRFCVAVSRKHDKENTDFIPCVAFEKKAELISKYVKKGNKIMISGELHIDKSQENGENKYFTTVVIEDFEFLENKKSNETGDGFPF